MHREKTSKYNIETQRAFCTTTLQSTFTVNVHVTTVTVRVAVNVQFRSGHHHHKKNHGMHFIRLRVLTFISPHILVTDI